MTPQQLNAMKLALDLATMHHTDDGYAELRAKVRSALNEALAEHAMREVQRLGQEIEQEPVACIGTHGELMWLNKPNVIYSKPQPLYTSPPQRKPLTDEQIYMNCPNWLSQEQCKTWVRQIEAAHGIKENT